MQASAYIPGVVFVEFNLKEDVIFKINLSILVECLCMFWSNINTTGSSVALELFYKVRNIFFVNTNDVLFFSCSDNYTNFYLSKGIGNPLSILLEENGIITDCSLKTQHPEELLDFHLEPENVINKVVLQTELLKDILYELDQTSEVIEVTLA